MAITLHMVVFSAFLIVNSFSAPWSDNVLKENNPEWQCKQLCIESIGKPKYDSDNTTCYCQIDNIDNSDIDWTLMKQNAKILGLFLEILDSKTKKVVKRGIEIPSKTVVINNELNDDKKEDNKKIEPSTTEPTLGLPLMRKRLHPRPLMPQLPHHPLPRPRPILPHYKYRLGNPKHADIDNGAADDNKTKSEQSEKVISVITKIRERISKLRSASPTKKVTPPSLINIVAPENNLIVQPKETLIKQ